MRPSDWPYLSPLDVSVMIMIDRNSLHICNDNSSMHHSYKLIPAASWHVPTQAGKRPSMSKTLAIHNMMCRTSVTCRHCHLKNVSNSASVTTLLRLMEGLSSLEAELSTSADVDFAFMKR